MNETSFIFLHKSPQKNTRLSETALPAKNDKRERILNAAIRIFARRGFYYARVSEIAKAAGIADGTIYLYFKNKDEILISIFEQEMEKFIVTMEDETRFQKTGLEKVRKFVKTHLDFVRRNPSLAHVLQLELRQSNRFMRKYSGSKLKEYLALLSRFIEQGQREGDIRTDVDPGLLKRALFGALDEIATHWVLQKNGKYNLDLAADQVADIFLSGVSIFKEFRSET